MAPRSLDRGLFQSTAVRQIFVEHRARSRDNADRIWRLLNLELWQQVFIDQDPARLKGIELDPPIMPALPVRDNKKMIAPRLSLLLRAGRCPS